MQKMLEAAFVKNLKFRTIFPFYINNVNEKFFDGYMLTNNQIILKNIIPKLRQNWKPEELQIIQSIQNLKKPEQIQAMLNFALKKIVKHTLINSQPIFQQVGLDNFNDPLYVRINKNFSNLEILGDVHEEHRFTYSINVNKDDPLFDLSEQIQLAFYVDKEKNQISGGFSINSGKDDVDLSFLECIDKHYLLSIIKKFVKSQLYPLNLENLLEITFSKKINSATKPKSKKNELFKAIDFDDVSLDELKKNWKRFINKKLLHFKNLTDEQKQQYENKLLFSIMTLSLIMLYLIQEINLYFTSEKPELILSLLYKINLNEVSNNPNQESRYFNFAKFVRDNYRGNEQTFDHKKIKIRDLEDFIETLANYQAPESNNVHLGDFISTYEVNQIQEVKILDKTNFLYDNLFKIFFLILLFPESYSLSIDNPNLIEYQQLLNNIRNQNELEIPNSLLEKIEESICEMNHHYASFISEETVLILKNNFNLYDKNKDDEDNPLNLSESKRLYNNYFWAEIYLQSKIYQKGDLELKLNKLVNANFSRTNGDRYKFLIGQLNDLHFDWYDHFYGISDFKKIVKKIDENNNFKNSLEILVIKARNGYWFHLEHLLRNYIILVFIAVCLNIFTVFIGATFTTIATSTDGISYPILYTCIAFVTLIMFCCLGIMLWAVYKYLDTRKEARKISRR